MGQATIYPEKIQPTSARLEDMKAFARTNRSRAAGFGS